MPNKNEEDEWEDEILPYSTTTVGTALLKQILMKRAILSRRIKHMRSFKEIPR